MRRVPPSMLAREELDRLFHGDLDTATNVVSALVETVTRLVRRAGAARVRAG